MPALQPAPKSVVRSLDAHFERLFAKDGWSHFERPHPSADDQSSLWSTTVSADIAVLFSYRAWRRTSGKWSGQDAALAVCYWPLHRQEVASLIAAGHTHPMSHQPSWHLWVPLLKLVDAAKVKMTRSATYEPLSASTATEVVSDFQAVIPSFLRAHGSVFGLLAAASAVVQGQSSLHVNNDSQLLPMLRQVTLLPVPGDA
jgi:hypothetical protein